MHTVNKVNFIETIMFPLGKSCVCVYSVYICIQDVLKVNRTCQNKGGKNLVNMRIFSSI